ncbi:MAG: hypothetical protein KAX09_08340 [Candidatus Heimdallarchaeota archaeon]|nr:hypothetical protein [Candidatus Heimdallarchaeota archaeon]MCK4290976.1 hypothetical protein [Candidatus Heimdallarchaeota archaeon]
MFVNSATYYSELIVVQVYVHYDDFELLGSASVSEGENIYNLSLVNLPCSNTSVSFLFSGFDTWTPRPQDYVLAPGENSSTNSYNLVDALYPGSGHLLYYVYAQTEDSDATVQMRYYIYHKSYTNNLESDLPIIGIAFLIVISLLFKKKKARK